jgi:hypothetical protein
MTFLNPAAFWGLFLVAIPIIIHLFNFRKVKKLYFSNVAFLTSVNTQSKSKSTLKKLLVLLFRILAIVALVLAFAQPVKTLTQSNLATSRAYYLDNSLSMGRQSANGNDLFSESVNLFSSLTASNQANGSIAFTTNDFDQFHRPIYLKKISELLSDLSLSNKMVDFERVQSKLKRIEDGSKEVVIISDFQKNSYSNLDQAFSDTTLHYSLFKLSSGQDQNLFVDSVLLDNPIGLPTKNNLGIRITNIGDAAVKNALLKVLCNGNQLSSFGVDMEANSSTWVEIMLPENRNIIGNYEVEIEDKAFALDNKFYFNIGAFDRPTIFQIFQNKPNPYLNAVYSNEEYFDRHLAEIGKVSAADMMKSDLIVLDHLEDIPAWLLNQLNDFDKTILVFPSGKMNLSSLETLTKTPIQTSLDTSRYDLASSGLEHPFFQSVFSQTDKNPQMPWVKRTIELPSGLERILTTTSGANVLSRLGTHIYVFGSSLDDQHTNLIKHGLFLPLMYKLSLSARQSPVLSYTIGDQMIPLRNDTSFVNGKLKLHHRDGVIVPCLNTIDGLLYLEVPAILDQPGFYQMVSDGDTLGTLSFNLPRRESQLEVLTDDEMTTILEGKSNVELSIIEDAVGYADALTSEREGFPLWKYALLLALIFLVVEMTLLRVFK